MNRNRTAGRPVNVLPIRKKGRFGQDDDGVSLLADVRSIAVNWSMAAIANLTALGPTLFLVPAAVS